MGATPYADVGGTGTTFRIWAPNSATVSVAGEFNSWNKNTAPLVSEGGGIWSVDVSGASHGQEYKYVLNRNTASEVWKKDPRGREVTYSGEGAGANSIIYDPGAFDWEGINPPEPWQNDLVIYEMHVGAFYDPTPFNNFPGTFYDATNQLDYIQSMGINAVELMPVAEYPGDRSWGYNPAEIFAVENVGYGGPDGLKTFVREANRRGIAVFLDTVHNHYETYGQDLWDFDTGFGPGVYFFPDSDGKCCTPWGPRPNYSTDQVRSFIIDNINMWVDEYHIGGLRWDSVGSIREYDAGGGSYLPVPFGDALLSEINNNQLRGNPNRDHVFSFAEDRPGALGFHGEWMHSVKDTIVDVATQPSDGSRDMVALWNAANGSGHFRVLFTDSHDTAGNLNGGDRLPVKIDNGDPDSYYARKRSMLAASVILSAPGVPMLLMGQEMLEDAQFSDQNPLDWGNTNTYPGVVQFYRDMIRLRRNLDGVSLGLTGPSVTQQHLNDSAKVLAYHRWGAGADDQVMIIMNWSNTSFPSYNLGFPENGTWYVNLNSDWPRYGSDFSNVGPSVVQVAGLSGTVGIGPYSVLVLSRQAHPGLDHDGDGLLSGWEQQYFGDPLIAVATDDGDNDGADNAHEQAADTIPTQTESVLKLLSVQRHNGTLTLSWKGGVNVRQVVQKATSPGGVWSDVYTNTPPTPVTNSMELAALDDECYFRVSAVPGD